MARGRMLNRSISADKRVHELSDDTSRLAFTWLIAHLDCEGRVEGDPALVRSLVFPRRTDVSVEQMEAYIREWSQAIDPETGLGLVVCYQAKGDRWLWFPGFEGNQPGLNKAREAASRIPAPPAELMQCARPAPASTTEEGGSDSGVTPESDQSDAGNAPAKSEENTKRSSREENITQTQSGAAAPEEGVGDPGGDTGADDDASAPGPEERAEILALLCDEFCERTGISPPPEPRGRRARDDQEAQWVEPLARIGEAAGWDVDAASKAMAEAVEQLRSKECIMTCPRSIAGTTVAVLGVARARRAKFERINEMAKARALGLAQGAPASVQGGRGP